MQNIVESILRHIPDVHFLVIDNNPSMYDSPDRAQSYRGFFNRAWTGIKLNGKNAQNIEEAEDIVKDVKNSVKREKMLLKYVKSELRHNPIWLKFCEAERDWLNSHPRIVVSQTEGWLDHGPAINFAMAEGKRLFVKKLIHIEWDCLITGNRWYHNLQAALDDSLTGVGGSCCTPEKLAPITPSIWWTEKASKLDFSSARNVDVPENCRYKDTAGYAWHKCQEENTVALADTPDFKHLWYGRYRIHPSAICLL